MEWLYTKASPKEIADGSWEFKEDNIPASLSPNRVMKGLQLFRPDGVETISIDCAFPIMHGELCEDGAIQGLFELAGIPYVGPDICASACSMDKAVTKVGEVLAANEFYDYNAKYENNESRTVIPAQIPKEASDKLRAAAVRIYRAMGCSGLSRVDFFLLDNDEIVFNEINTIPGFTKISMYPMLWEAAGLPYSELLTKLCEFAIERGCRVK